MNKTNLVAHSLDSTKADSLETPANNRFLQAVENMSQLKECESQQDEFGRRKRRIRELCAKLNITEEKFCTAAFFIVDERKVLICAVGKTGTSTIRRTFQTRLNLSLETKYELTEKEYHEKYFDYNTIMSVRHPIERIVSAYRNKLLNRMGKFKQMGEHMKELYRKDRSPEAMKPKVYFNEFIQYFLNYPRDEHWDTYINLCNPCKINYDMVIRHETFQMDFANVMKMYSNLTLTQAKALMLHRNGSGGKSSSDLAKKLMAEIPNHARDQIYRVFKDDFDLFEYDYNW